jgi:hypothetical protein
MAEIESKAPTTEVGFDSSSEHDVARPRGWMYKRIGVGKWNVGWYASPKFQLGMVAFVCFMCPGMFNALGGLGGGGKADAHLADQMVSSLQTRRHPAWLFLSGCAPIVGISDRGNS